MMMDHANASDHEPSALAQGAEAYRAPSLIPRISVVLPVHNGAAYLSQAIVSILGQTLTEIELICVDDGSTDDTPQILLQHAALDSRVRIITNRPNRGLPGALNVGFAEARGALHCWTSDDNIARPHMLERLAAALDSHPHAAIAHANYSVIDQRGTVTGFQKVGPASEILFGNRIGAAFLYRAEVTQTLGGYDEALFGVEDYDFWLRAARSYSFVTLDEDLYLYRRHGASLTDRRARTIHRLGAQIIMRELAFVDDPALRARVLLEHGTASRVDPRLGMLVQACALSPMQALHRAPVIARHLAAHAKRLLQGRGE
ncbi:glycosyltransferase family A protein [Novosphingobium sp. AAP83]|uniref:glycosyltransferase family 2 protein n=1 Tax=Novosphingobium sp. AAP83 TaxID=1523425 RepID=UPI0006B8A723|nr:glycosyltransferase family A protein [Novosphingobium sp. AAP83]